MPEQQVRGLRAIFNGAAGPGVTVALCGSESARIAGELACAIGMLGQRVLLIDRTRGEAAAALGVKARYDRQHALQRDRRIAEVIVPVEAARRVFDGVAETAGRFLAAELEFTGYLPRESASGRPIVAARGPIPGAAFMTIARAVAAGPACGA